MVMTKVKQDENLELTIRTFVGHVNLSIGTWQTAISLISMGNVSDSSNPLEQFRVTVGTGTEQLELALPHENPDRWNWACFTTKNPAFQLYNFGFN
jgi:hypothetical protein